MRWSARVVLLVALLGACDDGGEEGATSTSVPAATTTTVERATTTAAPDPFAVPADPADMDEAYVEAVLAELERINGDALRLAVSEGLSPEIRAMIESINAPEQAAFEIENLVDASLDGFAGMSRPPGDVAVVVDDVLVATPECVSMDATEDYTAIGPAGVSGVRTRIVLVPSDGRNPTPWVVSTRVPLEGTDPPPEPCG